MPRRMPIAGVRRSVAVWEVRNLQNSRRNGDFSSTKLSHPPYNEHTFRTPKVARQQRRWVERIDGRASEGSKNKARGGRWVFALWSNTTVGAT